MVEQERSCQFHWSQALEHHTKQFIEPELQKMHNRLCHEYRKCWTKADAEIAMQSIKAWWFSLGSMSESGLKEMNK